ncbi:unnamed protein product [Gongylonema pulchrum]|uniref:Uncharacterized protein n=1 Tax=Gongylonema pulchrum TaxID=637853 RepID=A0A3P6RWB3_9BILA|nr:unnamed protein product [Gongylonema pulchrum]
MLYDRQRREVFLARLRSHHSHPRAANTLTPTGGGYMTRSVDSSESSRHIPFHILYHHPAASYLTSRVMLSSSISLPGSPPQNSFLGQHGTQFRDGLVCLIDKFSCYYL